MTTHELAFDEDRGGPRNPNNYLSLPDNGAMYLATKAVLPWEPCGAHDSNRVIVASHYVE